MTRKYGMNILLVFALFISGCGNKEKPSPKKFTSVPKADIHTSQNSLD